MPGRYQPPYSPEFRSMVVELYRAGRTLASLTKEFRVNEMTVRAWAKQAELDRGARTDGVLCHYCADAAHAASRW